MKKHSYMLFLLIFYTVGYSQTFFEKGQLGNFTSSSGFAITPTKFFYVSDSQTNEVIKLHPGIKPKTKH